MPSHSPMQDDRPVRRTADATPSFPPAPLRLAIALSLLALCPGGWAAVPPTESWLRYYSLAAWESVLDQDQDGFSAEEEFAYGTNPLDAQSHPPRFVPGTDGLGFQVQIAAGVSYGSADLQTSTDLASWTPVPGFPPPGPGTFTVPVQLEEAARFFRFAAPGLTNADGDCLMDFEELNLFFTDPPPPDPVDASVVLGALPPPPIAGPFGGWAHVDILAIPTNSFLTVAFDGEEIFDGPGPDLAIWCAAGTAEDAAEISCELRRSG